MLPRPRIHPPQRVRRPIRPIQPHHRIRFIRILLRIQNIKHRTTNTRRIHIHQPRPRPQRNIMHPPRRLHHIRLTPHTLRGLRCPLPNKLPNPPPIIHHNNRLIQPHPGHIHTQHRPIIRPRQHRIKRPTNLILRKKRVIILIRELPQHLRLKPCRVLHLPRPNRILNPFAPRQPLLTVQTVNLRVRVHPLPRIPRQIIRRNVVRVPQLLLLRVRPKPPPIRARRIRVPNRNRPRISTRHQRLHRRKNRLPHLRRTSLIQQEQHPRLRTTSTLHRRNLRTLRRRPPHQHRNLPSRPLKIPVHLLINPPRQQMPTRTRHRKIILQIREHPLLQLCRRRSQRNHQNLPRLKHRHSPRRNIRHLTRLPRTISRRNRRPPLLPKQRLHSNLIHLLIRTRPQHIRLPRHIITPIQLQLRPPPQLIKRQPNNRPQTHYNTPPTSSAARLKLRSATSRNHPSSTSGYAPQTSSTVPNNPTRNKSTNTRA